ncbi:MAG TPA: hypothetical protein PLU72_10820 [Candidatus Ozemobacteraceae bacterium]|nr:hypothetical protein [Candidatus Ozemobacteraceae bacterium]HQG29489.1 hypothetical protein [Candidatus Ozemobacteraceae bacterium]
MRSKFLLLVLAIAALTLSTGCGGGGGGGSSTPASYTVTGTVAGPDTIAAGWNASVRGAIPTGLKARAYGKTGTSISEQVALSGNSFTLTVTPDDDVLIKVTNENGFDFRYNIGVLNADKTIEVNSISTAKALLTWQQTNKPSLSDAVVAQIVAAITAALGVAPEAGKTLTDLSAITTLVNALKTKLQTEYSAIKTNNTAVEQNLKTAETLNTALMYISEHLDSTASPKPQGYGYEDFRTVMQDRYTKWTVNSYTFSVQDINFTTETTASVTVSFSATATNKTSGANASVGPVTKVVGWAKEEGVWKIIQNLPYRSEELTF